jgi:spore maturation protein SpmA
MALNYIWSGFFLVGFIAALAQWIFLGDTEIFKKIIDGTFDSAKLAVMDIALPLAGVMTLWLGLMNVGEKAGAVGFLARIISPFFSRIFPDVPRDHPATGHMVMNFSANLLGLDNAATPFGLKAMESLQTLNPNKDEASNPQIMFLVLHTSGLTLIPLHDRHLYFGARGHRRGVDPPAYQPVRPRHHRLARRHHGGDRPAGVVHDQLPDQAGNRTRLARGQQPDPYPDHRVLHRRCAAQEGQRL